MTKELINITEDRRVDARHLHERLQSNRKFSNWIVRKIKIGRCVAGEDYEVIRHRQAPSPKGGRPRIDYLLNIETAKHFCMLEGTKIGRQIRQYFIKCEQALREIYVQQDPALPEDYPSALRALADQVDEYRALQHRHRKANLRIANLEPKALAFDSISPSIGWFTVEEIAKNVNREFLVLSKFQLGRTNLYQFLRSYLCGKTPILQTGENRWQRKHNLPYQRFVDSEHCRIVEKSRPNQDGIMVTYSSVEFSEKGKKLIIRLLVEAKQIRRREPLFDETFKG